MSHFVITGGRGFLGQHLRAALLESEIAAELVTVGADFDRARATAAVDGADRVIHIAGVNRATDDEVTTGNILFAEQLASAILSAERPPQTVVFANSTQSTNGSVYGEAKARAGGILAHVAKKVGANYADVQLPNLFGEHGRPFYNAVTATFSHLIATGETPTVHADKELTLMHAQNAADLLSGVAPIEALDTLTHVDTVSGLLTRILKYAETYNGGEIPDVTETFDRDLFNTYRSYTFPEQAPIMLTRHADARGSFFEIVRSHGGPGQSSFSTTVRGVVRGDHFHRRKIERFTVLQGTGRISLRRLFTNRVISFNVTGSAPAAVDMPTMWAHNITNIGDDPLYTSFWTNDIFDPENPDTIAEAV